MGRPKKTALGEIAEKMKFDPEAPKAALTSPITMNGEQEGQKAPAPVTTSVTLAEKGFVSAKPDLLGHPYHGYLKEKGLTGLFSTKENLDFHASQGWRIFKRPANMPDQHVIFHGTDGDFVQRGDLTLMVRPEEMSKQEEAANLAAYREEVADLQNEMKQKAASPQVRSSAEGHVQIREAQFPEAKPVDELG